MEKTDVTDGSEEASNVKQVTLDTVLVEEVGFGLYQLKNAALLLTVVVFIAWSGVEFNFTTARIPNRCLIPECEDRSDQLEFAPEWILNAIPGTSQTSFDSCHRFAYLNASIITSFEDTCPATLFDQDKLIPCYENVYEHTNTVVYDFDLGCDEWRRSFIGSVTTIGTLFALPLTGYISDRWGRRTAITITAFNTAYLGIARYWASTYIGFVISQLIESALGNGGFSASFILMLELVGPKHRVAAGATMNTFWTVGQVTLGLIAWGVPYWRHLTLALYIPQLVTIAYFWLLSESIRWYLSKGRFEDAERVLKDAARLNRNNISDSTLLAMRQTAEEERKRKALEEQESGKEPWLVVQVFQHKPILLRCVLSPIWWISMTFIYHGLTINSVNMSGNPYFNFMAVSAIEIPGFWIGYVLLSRVGRRPVLAGAFWVCGACQLTYLFMPEGMYAVSLTVYLIGKCSIAMVVTAVYVYTTELYPTKHRHSLFAFSSMLGRIGSIVAPLTPAFGDNLPFILFGSFALLSGVLVLFTPETLGAKFPDTMEEASRIGKPDK